LPAGKTPEHLVLSPDERLLYAANPSSGTVSQVDIDSASVKSLFTVGADPHGVDLSDDGRLLYASSKKDDKVVAYNLASGEMKSLTLSPAPYHITTVRGTGKVYVSSRKSPKIWVLDQQTLTVLGEITIRGEGHEMGVVSR
jgi:DNA-binding beta-propeller fold protein YncE